jgi:hypothetical protein
MSDERRPDELRSEQMRREAVEHELAESTDDQKQAAQHQRRAQKAHYLRRKLDQQVASEREAYR